MNEYQKAGEFHRVFAPVEDKAPHALTKKEAQLRAHFMIEELVEYLAAAADSDATFQTMCQQLKESIDCAEQKVLHKQQTFSLSEVGQADALIDLLYFVYGSFVMMNTDPEPLYDIVHQANMGKLFADGKPHYDTGTGKVLKPENWEAEYAPERRLQQNLTKQKAEWIERHDN